MHHHDAIVVGAGPAGSSLALRLAQQGRSVLLVDGARFPRRKVCGEGLMPHGVQALAEVGLEVGLGVQGQPFEGIRYRLSEGSEAQGDFPGGARGLGVERSWLDTALVARAQATPEIEVRLGEWVREARVQDGARVIELSDGSHRAPVLIAADGCRSPLRRSAGLEGPAPARARFGLGGHVTHAPRADPYVEVYLGAGFELYTTPVSPSRTNVALLTDRVGLAPLQGRLEAGLRERLALAGPRGALLAGGELERARAIGPLAIPATRAHAEGLLLVGDAAGGLDPITGEGLSIGLATTAIAAQVLAEAYARNDFSARRLAPWTSRRREAIGSLVVFTRTLLYLSQRPRQAERVVRALARSPETFSRLLGVAAGGALTSLRLRDGLLLLGTIRP